jgi:amino acid adenylation domain-containing protein
MSQEMLSGYRLSPSQERLWRSMAEVPPATFSVRAEFTVSGEVESGALAQALSALVERHEILRTGFAALPEMLLPLQAPLPAAPVSLDGETEAASVWDGRLRAQLDGDRLTLTLPALCGDADTLLRLGAELECHLAAVQAAEADDEETLQFYDLTEWQHELLAEASPGAAPRWNDADAPEPEAACPSLAVLSPQPFAAFNPGRMPVALSDDITARLDACAARIGVGRVDLLAAVWMVLLHRLGNGAEIPVALVADGRCYDELTGVLGPLSRTAPLAARPADGMRFSDLARAIAAERAALAETLHYIVPPADDRFARFQIEHHETSSHPGKGARIMPRAVMAIGERFLLKLSALSTTDGLRLDLDYDAAVCGEAGIARLTEQFATLLSGVVDAVDAGLDEPDILGSNERQLVQHQFQGAVVPSASPWRPVHLAVGELAGQNPDLVAVADEASCLTAAELEGRVARLAVLLRRAGVAAETIVPLVLPRGIDLVVAMLAVLRAGGAYLPLPTDLPTERQRFILEDCGARHVVTASSVPEGLAAAEGRTAILTDALAAVEEAPLDLPVPTPEQAAYVLYTSGSTGQPKGVVVTHGSLANHMAWMNRTFPLSADDVVLQKTAAGFDASVWEFFAPLMQGAKLVLARPGLERDVSALAATLREQGVTILQVVPSLLRVLLDEPDFPSCTALRRVFCGGEALTPDLVRRLRERHGAALVNLYGPTEATIQVVVDTVSAEDDPIPVGRPIDNVQIHVVDRRGRPVPIGMRGEILIGGAALARGYLNRSALTAERFVADSASGARLYRTGDLGAWREDGRLDFFGRLDHQVKLRGYRIELGEIEALVSGHPAVALAAVVVTRDAKGIDHLLCAYTTRPDTAVEQADLRAHLAAHLPDYMVPGRYRHLDAMPLTSSGKIDRTALANLKQSDAAAILEARDTVELRLQRVWETVLDVHPVGIDQTFFDLGGHSLLAVRLMAEVQGEFGCDLPLVSLFQAPTVAAQAGLIRSRVPADPVLVPINRGLDGQRPIFFVHPTGGSVLCYRDLARRLGADQPFYALQDPGLTGTAEYSSVEELAALYVNRITSLGCDGPYCLGGWSSGGVIAFEMARQLLARGEEVGLLVLIDSQATTDADTAERTDSELLQSVAKLIAFVAGQPSPDLSSLLPEQGFDRLRLLAEGAGLLSPGAPPDQIERLFAVFRRNVDVIRRYRPGPYPGPALLLKATEPVPDALREAAVQNRSGEPAYGWDRHCTVTVREIAAHHLAMASEPAAALTGAEIRQALAEAGRLQDTNERELLTLFCD